MASTPTYLPVYQLSSTASPTVNDLLVLQSSAANGDVGLMTIDTFVRSFSSNIIADVAVDTETTIPLYVAMGWEPPT